MQAQDDKNLENEASPPKAPQLTAIELRVLGALMEKQITTPDQYPLTVNSIISACNQKSSRDPVSSFEQGEIVRTLQNLEDRRFVRREFGSRADKYSQQFIQYLELGKKQQALLCVMMLRGPQTLSELCTRTLRMEVFSDKDELAHSVDRLCNRELPLAMRLGHQPGQRGERVGHLFCGTPEQGSHSTPVSNSQPRQNSSIDKDELEILTLEVAELRIIVEASNNKNVELKLLIEKLYELTGHSQLRATDT
jgi:uncharacterized protein YceH (UPF0502 family)